MCVPSLDKITYLWLDSIKPLLVSKHIAVLKQRSELKQMLLEVIAVMFIFGWSFFVNLFWYLVRQFCISRPPVRQTVSKLGSS